MVPWTDTFVAYDVNPSTGNDDDTSNTVSATWKQEQLQFTSAGVYHTPTWEANLNTYNQYYQTNDPSLVRSQSDFWAGEELVFKMNTNFPSDKIAQAYAILPVMTYNQYMYQMPNYQAPPAGSPPNGFYLYNTNEIPLTYNAANGDWEGNTDPALATWFQYLFPNGVNSSVTWATLSQDGINPNNYPYTVTFWVKGTDGQIATTTAQAFPLTQFVIDQPWVSGNNPGTFDHTQQTY
jgi:hypothetical protein